MKTIIPKSLNDLTLKQYLQFTEVAETLKGDGSVEDTLKTYRLVEIVTNMAEEEVDALSIPEVNDISQEIKSIIDNFEGFKEEYKAFNIDGIDYAAKNIDELDNGEYISLNILKEQYGNDLYKMFPKLLAVLIRPAKLEYDFETKTEKWVIEKYNRRDIDNMEWRADLFLNRAKAGDVIPIINFFLSMNKK